MRQIAFALALVFALAAADPIRRYNIDKAKVTVGGLSAGAFMAVQYHVAFSSKVHGAAIFAGGPFNCAQDSLVTATTTCMNPLVEPGPNAQALADLTVLSEISGRVDVTTNLTDDKVYIYSGVFDSVVKKVVVQATEAYYRLFINATQGGNVTTNYDILSEHCWPTLNYGEYCSSLGSPYIGKCNFDGAGAALQTLYGQLNGRGQMIQSNLMQFDQTKFATGNSLNSVGYIYVPTACQNNATCALHINFHGCEQSTNNIGTEYVMNIGVNEWAETNNIIVLYPQVVPSYLIPSNPEGCWDWWGYTGSDYAFQSGAQMQFVHSLQGALGAI